MDTDGRLTSGGENEARVERWRAVTILTLVVGYAGYYLCRSDLAVATPLIVRELGHRGMTESAIGSISSWGILFYSIGKVLSGLLCDRFGGRRPFLAAMLVAVLCTWTFGAASGLLVFTVVWILNRAVQSTGWSALVKISANWFSYKQYGRVMGILSLSWLFGDTIGRLFLGGLMSRGLGWRGVFFVAGGVLFAIWILSIFCVKETPEDVGGAAATVNPDNLFSDADDPRDVGLVALLAPFLTSASFWAVMAMCFGMTLIRESFLMWTPTWLVATAGMAPGAAASWSSLYPLCGGFSVILCGWISDRFLGGKRGLMITVPLILLLPTLMGMGRLTPGAGSTLPITLMCLASFLMMGPYSFLGGAISLDLGGRHGSATAAGLVDGAGYLGGTLSGYGVARIAATSGWSTVFFTLTGVALFATAGAVYYWLSHEVWLHRRA